MLAQVCFGKLPKLTGWQPVLPRNYSAEQPPPRLRLAKDSGHYRLRLCVNFRPAFVNSVAFCFSPSSIASASVSPCSAANFRTSSVIFMEQKCGPHMEQKYAVLAPSAGNGFVVKLTQALPALSPSRVCPSMSPPSRSAPFTRLKSHGSGISKSLQIFL